MSDLRPASKAILAVEAEVYAALEAGVPATRIAREVAAALYPANDGDLAERDSEALTDE